MKEAWLLMCQELMRRSGGFWCGCRKIHRGVTRRIPNRFWTDDLTMADAGYTSSKMTMLLRNYYHEESHQVALEMWERRKKQGKYGSVGFSTYNHLLKGNVEKKSKRASVMGPCIQSVTLTLLPDGSTGVDLFYRTTELFKKFPADLVFIRDKLLAPFKLENLDVDFHLANVTVHPMYYATIIPHLKDPIADMEITKMMDPHMWKWIVKWTARYLCEEYGHGIQKFAQAKRVGTTLEDALDEKKLKKLRKYLRANHPGYRNAGNT